MTVYVDGSLWRLGRMVMCHMMADTDDELHAMARAIGLRREWFQADHYDICKSKRTEAVANGAVEVDSRELVKLRQQRRIRATLQHAVPGAQELDKRLRRIFSR